MSSTGREVILVVWRDFGRLDLRVGIVRFLVGRSSTGADTRFRFRRFIMSLDFCRLQLGKREVELDTEGKSVCGK